jgi:Iron only hydrogenase large subunit, C-terminal domain
MEKCLQTKDSNCKNCYKCIRNCPVKSLKFTEGQAHIIHNECILCGQCYVVCPQNAKQIRNDLDKAKNILKSGKKVFASLAPSFVLWYDGKNIFDICQALKKLGFTDVNETAIGATIVKKEYEKMIEEGKSLIISSCCHSVNALIQKHFTDAINYLAPVVSPMMAHAISIKKENPDAKVIFIGPCISKKAEADKYPGVVDCVLTFEELDNLLSENNITVESNSISVEKGRASSFPTSGGILECMDKKDNFNYIAIDGLQNCIDALREIEAGNMKDCFIEMSACAGSCLAGPLMKRKKHNPIKNLVAIKDYTGNQDFKTNDIGDKKNKKFEFEGIAKTSFSSQAINEILRKMGKSSHQQELNCGSCGYDTCREKAEAVLMGKADLTMCLPFLKDKAENFSDTVINNTPNGIIVLNEQLEIQQINKAAKNILNLPENMDIVNSPVVRILDPVDYVVALEGGENVYDRKKYLVEYQKYVEETIVCDKEYQVIMIIIKDVSGEEKIRTQKESASKAAVEITDKVVEKQMRVVQEIASLLGETTAETKIALTKLKETLSDE